jgi:hypothetical protein
MNDFAVKVAKRVNYSPSLLEVNRKVCCQALYKVKSYCNSKGQASWLQPLMNYRPFSQLFSICKYQVTTK